MTAAKRAAAGNLFRAGGRRRKDRRWWDRLLILAGFSNGVRLPDDVNLALS